jgi:phenylalanyl-tRNA synthetase beta chain
MVLEQVMAFKEALVEEVHLFDLYEGSPIPAGRKSISFRVTYRSQKKTLVDNDIHKLHEIITKRLMEQFNATLP